ncbi:uncharacterized protein METZ01_LOCUS413064, partial [marine metagenome]
VVESTGLENRRTLIAYLGFKSLSLRHIRKAAESSAAFFISALPFFSYQCTEHYRFQISA